MPEKIMRKLMWLTLCFLLSFAQCAIGGASAAKTAFPLQVDANGRYLVDANGKPFLMIGDAPQALMVNASLEDAVFFMDDRVSRGFNTVWIMLLVNEYCGGRPDASTYDGLKPFTTAGDLSTPNEAYFARCDQVLRAAADRGLAVILDPIETGGFLSMMRSNGVTKCRAYGRYVGNRYKDFDNIIWMSGSDFQTWADTYDYSVVKAVAEGIKETAPSHIQTLQLNYYVSSSLDDTRWSDIVNLNAAYTYYPTYAEVLKSYNRNPGVPVFLIEADYEGSNSADAERIRRQAYWSLLAGACGHVYGNHYVWALRPGWKDHLDTVGVKQFGHCKALLRKLPWHTLVPDQANMLITAGYGTYSSGGPPYTSISTNDYITAASTPDGRLALAYVPTARTITVDLTRFSGAVTARWYNPTTGAFKAISGAPFGNTGSRGFSTPGRHSDGASDWILVFEVK